MFGPDWEQMCLTSIEKAAQAENENRARQHQEWERRISFEKQNMEDRLKRNDTIKVEDFTICSGKKA